MIRRMRKIFVIIIIVLLALLAVTAIAARGRTERSGSEALSAEPPGGSGMTSALSGFSQDASMGADGSSEENDNTLKSYDITLGFAGDICFADNYIPVQHYNAIGATSLSDVISQNYIDEMRKVDLMWINNEFCYSTRGEPLAGKAYTFRADPSHVKWMSDLGVDIVGLANNHVYDFGPEAFDDTLTTLEDAGIPYVGAGRNLNEAKKTVYLTAGGLKIAYVAASRAEKWGIDTPEATDTDGGILLCYDNTLFLQEIREAAANADYVVALVHWGTEHSTELEEEQTEGAREYIEAGADAVIGAHPHILQGIEYIDGKPVLYSLGNFWFDDYDQDTMIAELHLSGTYTGSDPEIQSDNVELRIIPGRQENCETRRITVPSEADRLFGDLEALSPGVTIENNGICHETQGTS